MHVYHNLNTVINIKFYIVSAHYLIYYKETLLIVTCIFSLMHFMNLYTFYSYLCTIKICFIIYASTNMNVQYVLYYFLKIGSIDKLLMNAFLKGVAIVKIYIYIDIVFFSFLLFCSQWTHLECFFPTP